MFHNYPALNRTGWLHQLAVSMVMRLQIPLFCALKFKDIELFFSSEQPPPLTPRSAQCDDDCVRVCGWVGARVQLSKCCVSSHPSALGGQQADALRGRLPGPLQQARGRLLLLLAGGTPAAAPQSLVQRRYRATPGDRGALGCSDGDFDTFHTGTKESAKRGFAVAPWNQL